VFSHSLAALAWTHVGYPLAVAALARLRPRPVAADDLTPAVMLIVAVTGSSPVPPIEKESQKACLSGAFGSFSLASGLAWNAMTADMGGLRIRQRD
jgi:hypothetical protein